MQALAANSTESATAARVALRNETRERIGRRISSLTGEGSKAKRPRRVDVAVCYRSPGVSFLNGTAIPLNVGADFLPTFSVRRRADRRASGETAAEYARSLRSAG